jgi:hypothetical protein
MRKASSIKDPIMIDSLSPVYRAYDCCIATIVLMIDVAVH